MSKLTPTNKQPITTSTRSSKRGKNSQSNTQNCRNESNPMVRKPERASFIYVYTQRLY